jgi:hypothetical protein
MRLLSTVSHALTGDTRTWVGPFLQRNIIIALRVAIIEARLTTERRLKALLPNSSTPLGPSQLD